MADVLVAPDVPALVLGWLADNLDIDTDVRVPNPRPARFVTARRVGGTRRDVVLEDVTVAFECWADDRAEADDLGQETAAWVHALAGQTVDGHVVYRVTAVAEPADLPDLLSDQPRHTFTAQVTVRCLPIIQSS